MESASDCRAEEQPPALPVKQRRNSSVDSDCFIFSPVGRQRFASNDVFQQSTDCHATQCPIHQHDDLSKQQMRAFSESTPPPVPKKRLVRSLSLPATDMHLHSPLPLLSPWQRHLQNFDNPLYMMAQIADTFFTEEVEDIRTPRGSPDPLLSLTQLSFDTPDEHLPTVFSNFEDQQVVSQGIQHRHLLSLRSMAESVEARSLLQGEAAGRGGTSYQLQDFLQCESREPKQIGDSIYYSLRSPEFPKRVLGLKVHKQTNEASSAHAKHLSPHVNVQKVIAYSQPNILKSNAITMQYSTASSCSLKSDCSNTTPTDGSCTERATDSPSMRVSTVEAFLQKGYSVSIVRDLPDATLQDFVQERSSLQSSECSDYDRQVCVLLLQILMGTHHLYRNGSAPELRPREILLVWPGRMRNVGENELKQEAGGRRGSRSSREEEEMDWEKTERRNLIHALWKMHGSPCVVLVPQSSALSVAQPLTSIKFQIGALIQFCLQPQESPTSLGSVPSAFTSSYSRGLLLLSTLLQSENGPQITNIVDMLRVLLWGPRVPLLDHRCSSTTAVQNWLTIKRALLMMKLAERGLNQDQSVLDWEDCMRLQYLSLTDSETIMTAAAQLWNTLSSN